MGKFEAAFAAVGKAFDEAFSSSAPAEKEAKAAAKTGKPGKTAGKASKAKKDDGPTVEDVRAALRRVIDKGGNDGATEILEKFDAKKVSGLDKDQFASVIEACEEYLDEADADADDDDPTE